MAGVGVHTVLQDVPAGLQVALGRADVHPVAVKGVTVQPMVHQARKHLALDRHHPSRGDQIQDLALQDVSPGRDLVGVDVVRIGLLDELDDLAARALSHEAVGARIVHPVQSQGGDGAALVV